MDYEICRYTPNHRSEILDLQRHLWGPDRAANDRYFAWKYERNPYLAEPLIFLALAAGRVVGMGGSYRTDWHVGRSGRGLGVLCIADAVVVPEHQRRGLWLALSEALCEAARGDGWSFIVYASPARVVRDAALKRGWQSIGQIRPWVSVGETHEESEASSLAPFDQFRARLEPGISLSRSPRPGPMADLAARLPARTSIRQTGDVGFFRWRFANPLCAYRFIYREAGEGRIGGYLVVQSHGTRHGTGYNIVDWEVDAPATLDALLSALRVVVPGTDVTTWPGGDDPELDAAFARAGFSEAPPPDPPWVLPTLLILPLDGSRGEEAWTADGVDLLDLRRWHLRMSMSDFY